METQETLDSNLPKNSNSEKKQFIQMTEDKDQRERAEEQVPSRKDIEESTAHMHEQLSQLQAEVDDFKDKYLRSIAEMDNLRKRLARERSDLLKFGSESLLRDVLPVLDSFDQALQASDESNRYAEGVQLVRKQLLDVLASHGLKPLVAKDQPFDPHLHQAIQRIDSAEVEAETVQQEFQKGYMFHDRLLRPAMVAVAVPKKKDE